jgi:hypothetical protein
MALLATVGDAPFSLPSAQSARAASTVATLRFSCWRRSTYVAGFRLCGVRKRPVRQFDCAERTRRSVYSHLRILAGAEAVKQEHFRGQGSSLPQFSSKVAGIPPPFVKMNNPLTNEVAVMEHKWDPDAMRWIPKEQPFSRPKPRQVNRHMLLRGLAEEVVYEDTIAQLYAGLLVGVICDGNPTAKREYERMLAQEWQKAKSFVKTERIG